MDIRIENLKKGLVKRSEFKEELQKQMPRYAYFFSNRYAIAFSALKLIKDLKVIKSKGSVNAACKAVLDEFFSGVEDSNNNHHLFVINILDIHGDLPIVYKQQLELVAKRDLADIDKLLEHYNSIDFIESYRAKNALPRDHNQRTILEFYSRTLKKRNDLVDYILLKLEDRAIEKAKDVRRTSRKGENKSKFTDKYEKEYVTSKDFPYRDLVMNFRKVDYKYVINFERLDYRKINLVINKSLFFSIKCNPAKGYSKQFFQSVNKIKSTVVFKNLVNQIGDMPLLKSRRKVFKELQKLYTQRSWYAFYALALPQIEGIFAEMIRASTPSGKLSGALTDKVQQIRPFYENSEYSFDYYEFHLPLDRNAFSHTGKVEDVKRKCKILLLDLYAIVRIFSELDSAVVRAKNLLDLGVSAITDIGKLSNILHLIEKTQRDGLYADIKAASEEFIYVDLPKVIDVRAFLANLEIDFVKGFKKYRDQMHLFSGAFGERQVDINNLKGPNFQNDLKRIQEVHDKYTFMFQENLKLLLDTHYVVSNLPSLFPLLDTGLKNELDSFINRNKAEMKILKVLNEKLKVEIPEDFTLMRDELTHYLGKSW